MARVSTRVPENLSDPVTQQIIVGCPGLGSRPRAASHGALGLGNPKLGDKQHCSPCPWGPWTPRLGVLGQAGGPQAQGLPWELFQAPKNVEGTLRCQGRRSSGAARGALSQGAARGALSPGAARGATKLPNHNASPRHTPDLPGSEATRACTSANVVYGHSEASWLGGPSKPTVTLVSECGNHSMH